MNNNPLHRATLRHYAIFGFCLLFLIARLTGSVHLFGVGAIGALFIFPSDATGHRIGMCRPKEQSNGDSEPGTRSRAAASLRPL